MLAMGSVLVGVGILLAGLLAVLFRHPRAPRWSKPEIVAMLAVIPVTIVLGLGFGHVLVGSYRLLSGAGGPWELAAPAGGALAVGGLVSHVRKRLQAYAAAGGNSERAAAPILVAEAPPPSTPEAA